MLEPFYSVSDLLPLLYTIYLFLNSEAVFYLIMIDASEYSRHSVTLIKTFVFLKKYTYTHIYLVKIRLILQLPLIWVYYLPANVRLFETILEDLGRNHTC